MKVVSVHPDVVIATSDLWQTTCAIVHRGDETFVVDSPILPSEIEALPAIVREAGWDVTGLLCTHADFDHMLGRLAFPQASLGAGASTAALLRANPDRPARSTSSFDGEYRIERPLPLELGEIQELPVPGRLEIGDQELELIQADGHTEEGMAIWLPWASTLLCGDYISPCELPQLDRGPGCDAYAATLARLAPYVERAEWIVPGHGHPLGSEQASALLAEDLAYVRALAGDGEVELPARGAWNHAAVHAANVERVRAG